MIDRKHFEQKLLAKQRECQTELAALEGETRERDYRERERETGFRSRL